MDEKLNSKIKQRDDRVLVHQLKETSTEKQLELQQSKPVFSKTYFPGKVLISH
ncbi:hypothetical protein LG296_21230 (plasmid) [Ureibacillus chungkukjangi]|uniref:hypothetical protein n=2 Tax=Bacillales TaxID=1385 RepID=UPI0038508408